MEFKAKIAFTGALEKTVKNVPYKALNENGNEYELMKTDLNYSKTKMFTYDCVINSPEDIFTVDDDFALKVDTIMKPKPVVAPKQVPFVPVAKTINLKPEQLKIVHTVKVGQVDKSKATNRGKSINKLIDHIPFADYEDLTPDTSLSMLEMFIAETMKVGTVLQAEENLEDVLTVIDDLDLDPYQYAKTVLEFYGDIYEKYFPDSTDEHFIDVSEEACDMLHDNITQFPFINVTIKAIETMMVKFQEHATATV